MELLARLVEDGLRQLPGDQSMRRARIAGNLANYHEDRQDYAAALARAEEARRAFADHLGPTHVYTIMARDTIARVLSTQGRQDEAIAHATETLAIVRQAYGERTRWCARVIARGVFSATVSDGRGARLVPARPRHHEKLHGTEHPAVADALRSSA